MSNEHTPAPWFTGTTEEKLPSGRTRECPAVLRRNKTLDCNMQVVVLDRYLYQEEAEANAHLIAAAPDMLEALTRVDEGLSLLDRDKFGAMRFMIRAAINKATNLTT